ncbi:rRNA processing protein CgrA [Pyrenophora tritici-repentis]|uniref:rRNA-processing protein n=1 Tax=Pyrenophora tritici-repentis TaxID=45151 RepID=A0A2W1GEZ4_9PLEO|nr:Cgr1 multi-domain protein [Pyrenophora tritici-repentis]KAF7445969.1 Cgr1 multi-domain protein [Pyrenophora tritici-repentis]KAF7567066.1 Cgr1 multi-domain protein [Pyrenophora tritici-repentis]KAG9381675.1 Cgr1 multi-domain protein [Pyrenophora tritici-repentis]KAI0577416.1 Cgr1 multi-domain protein [Pyrenophora tritici-repentis]
MSDSVIIQAPPATETAPVKGMKKNGKQWHDNKAPFRPKAGQSSWEKRSAERAALAARRVEAIKTKRAAKEERERFAKMEEKMHKRRVERLKRREKRNKMLKS